MGFWGFGGRDDEEHDDRHFQGHHERVGTRRLAHSYVTHAAQYRDDQRRRQVEDRASHDHVIVRIRSQGCVGQQRREMDVGTLEKIDGVGGPAHGHRRRRHPVLEEQIPANEPGHRLSQSGVGVAIGTAGHRQERRQLRVAQRRKAASEGGYQ